ncbi:hypothetical protein DP939_00190 [Spongiactinospora rosea]|uniref:Uncharacterized protein n=1 Tax=Spongiactinospora rosea TaxID=2248750 RepID=A0A366M4R7_9ACTN|nr:hypothetical protein [Spongiactinospora rosea]RBQ21196.1 hypothetical protein DP939_00190 [Spongiactinospora rosea]
MVEIGAAKSVPANVPGASLTPSDMARVTPEDWAEIRKLARGYCRTVDATRPRKRMDGSATVVNGGCAPYGTDDVSDDVNQDAVLLFAQRLRDVISKFEEAPGSGGTRETQAWIYVRKDGGRMVIDRTTLQRWAVRDAAARNGYRPPASWKGTDAASGAQSASVGPDLEYAAVSLAAAQHSEEIFQQAFGDGREFPILKEIIAKAEQAEDLGRAGILSSVAQEREGGSYGSRSAVIRTRDAARVELQELSERLDDARNAIVYGGTEPQNSD